MHRKPFLWGAATSAFQIEGAPDADGKGPSIWDAFCREPGRIADASNGDVACDHYHRLESDVALLKDLHLKAYRFSLSWPRIQPEGMGGPNAAGLDFYERLVDQLLQKGIEPMPTLYHWDLPLALQAKGGWTHPDCALWFAEYASLVAKRLGDRISSIVTLNEPHVFTWLGYGLGVHAPGHKNLQEYAASVRTALLAHGRAVVALRSVKESLAIGIANSLLRIEPASPEETQAASRMDQIVNRIWLDPVIHGTLPPWAGEWLQAHGTAISGDDLQIINARTDFVGVNYYNRVLAQTRPSDGFPYTLSHPDYPGVNKTDIGWEVYADGLQHTLRMLRDDYGNIPSYITENGACYNDTPSPDGAIHDERRLRYLESHLEALKKSQEEGCDVRGYFAWSLMDNFEWAYGYSMRFGLVHVDYENQARRTLKDSAHWYRAYIDRQ